MKEEILNELNRYTDYEEINDFFKFLIRLDTKDHSLKILIEVMTVISSEISDKSVKYAILTDTLDYLTGYYGYIEPNSYKYKFIKMLELKFEEYVGHV